MSTIRELADTVQSYIRQQYGQSPRRARITVELDNGDPQEIVLSGANLAGPTDADGLGETERSILEVLANLDAGKKLTGEQIAAKLDYACSGRFKMSLSKLVKAGLITNHNPGYSMA